ncbi:hypothetical protein C8R44DRAFT_938818 [Mycena epipterygia]|nr:hypothetical protein C8R44DRAFT_938818 [Mycena epipterygia]
MAATAILNDVLPSSVPTLKATSYGNNFLIFSLRFLASVDAKGYLGHFDGTDTRPLLRRHWRRRMSLQRVPDSVALLLNPMPTVADMWNPVMVTYSTKGAYAQTNLRSQFLQSKCPASGNVHDFRSTIIGCLPQYLSGFASSQFSAAKLFSSIGTIPCSPFMTSISEEFDRKEGERKRRGKEKDEWDDSTPAAKSLKGTTAAADWDSESEGAWALDIASDSDESEMPELQPVSDSEDELMPVLQAVSDSDDESNGNSSDSDWFPRRGRMAVVSSRLSAVPTRRSYLRSMEPADDEADWIMAADWTEEYAMAVEMSVAEALEPRSLADARHRPDWPLWETASWLHQPADQQVPTFSARLTRTDSHNGKSGRCLASARDLGSNASATLISAAMAYSSA